MRRAYAMLDTTARIDGKQVRFKAAQMVGWTKPGTPLDRVNLSPYTIGRRIQPVNMAIRQQRRAFERACNR